MFAKPYLRMDAHELEAAVERLRARVARERERCPGMRDALDRAAKGLDEAGATVHRDRERAAVLLMAVARVLHAAARARRSGGPT